MTNPSSPLSKSEYESLSSFRYALRQFMRFSEQAAEAAGLKTRQHQALLAIKGFPGRDRITVGELAGRLQIRHHSAVGLTNRLVAHGWVAREHDTADRRQVYISLTPEGEVILEKLSAAHKQEVRRMAPQLKALLKELAE